MIQPIADEASRKKALRRAEQLWGAEAGSAGERELDALATLIDVYEQRTYPIEPLGPLDAIKTRCEYLGWSRRDLEPLIGSRARVSEVLSGKRPLTLAMIRRLHEALDIPADILIAECRRRCASDHWRVRGSARPRHEMLPNEALQLAGIWVALRAPSKPAAERHAGTPQPNAVPCCGLVGPDAPRGRHLQRRDPRRGSFA